MLNTTAVMYRQNDYFSFDEYGTGDIPEHREPCGAFYGIPFAGEDGGDIPLYVKEQLYDYMPDRNLLRGEVARKRPPQKKETPKIDTATLTLKTRELTEDEITQLRLQFATTYHKHAEIQRMYDLEEYIKIRFRLLKNKGKAL